MKTGEIYNGAYAERYLQTIQTAYTQLKCAAVADTIVAEVPQDASNYHFVIDFGGNIHGTVKNGLRGALEERHDRILYVPLDLSSAYFDAAFLQTKDPTIETYPYSRGIVADARDTKLFGGHANAVVLADVLEHIDEPEQVLREALRVLKPDGSLMLVSPSLYKLDVLKRKHPEVRNIVEGRRETSHVNFFDHELLYQQLGQTGFAVHGVRGIGYASGFPYLLWHNPDFIPSDNDAIVTPDIATFTSVKKAIGRLGAAGLAEIDAVLNDPTQGLLFLATFLADAERHPLEMIHEVVTLHPGYQEGDPAIHEVYQSVKSVIDTEKERFDAASMQSLLCDFLTENLYQYTANSILVQAKKAAD